MNTKIFEQFMYICMDLWSWDAEISYDMMKETIQNNINNLRSHMGEKAHRHFVEMGGTDLTDKEWKKLDKATQKQIDILQELFDYLETDSNWTP